ncbi:hypothetical protein NXS19_000843 [Fusarium pseudograminearum]|nr:hypothetical protein NXS19_000843 [Fusarium pseudograminearum]
MPRIKKKGQAGASKNYVTRNQAIRKLQISLPDFRKLCIWKGIYPREPRSRKKVSKSSTSSTTFYYTKDIQYLLHEPLLQKFRDQKVLEKKISRALGRGDVTDAARLEGNAARPEKTGKPRYTLDHVIRERYPTFIDAIRDLDDCLSMLFLFANLPSTSSVPAKMIARCERLCLEFQHYLIVSKSVTKSFLSIKGIYYQANIQGEEVLWLVPYKFNQRVVGDVDFRIMGTFIEFYMTLLGFVNFRLYTTLGLKYPPKFDQAKDEAGAELGAFTLEGKTLVGADEKEQKTLEASEHKPDPKVQAAVNKVIKKIKGNAGDESTDATEVEGEEQSGAIDKFEPAAPGGDILPQPSNTGSNPNSLFSNITVYLSRETPRQPLEFLLKSFGCRRVGWDAVLGDGAFTTNELDPNITHQVVDRPPIEATGDEEEANGDDNQTSQKLAANRRVPGRTYIQPQWVWDSVNDGELKEAHLYAPGAALPPHLSPFVRNVQGAYDPTVPLEEQEPERLRPSRPRVTARMKLTTPLRAWMLLTLMKERARMMSSAVSLPMSKKMMKKKRRRMLSNGKTSSRLSLLAVLSSPRTQTPRPRPRMRPARLFPRRPRRRPRILIVQRVCLARRRESCMSRWCTPTTRRAPRTRSCGQRGEGLKRKRTRARLRRNVRLFYTIPIDSSYTRLKAFIECSTS